MHFQRPTVKLVAKCAPLWLYLNYGKDWFPWTFRTTTVGASAPCPLLCPFSVPWPKVSQSTTQGCYEAVTANIRFKNVWTMEGKVRDTLQMGKINKPRETLGSSIHGIFLPYPMCSYWHVSFLSHPAVNKQPLPPGSLQCLRLMWRKSLRIGQQGKARNRSSSIEFFRNAHFYFSSYPSNTTRYEGLRGAYMCSFT